MPRKTTAIDAVVMIAGLARNLAAMAKATTLFPHAMIIGYNAMTDLAPPLHTHTHTMQDIITQPWLQLKISLKLFVFY